jgi:GNAT superfamily N-acetyltransferase
MPRVGTSLQWQHATVASSIEIRRLSRDELERIAEIDRTEHIDALYVQDGERLVERRGCWDSPAWERNGQGEHSIEAKARELNAYLDGGGIAIAALVDERVVGIGVVVPHLRPGVAQLAFLHVSAPWRGTGIGSRLAGQLDDVARNAGDTAMVVSATPSKNTVDFYIGRGFLVTAHPLSELFELEPDDVHMRKTL